MNTAQQIIESQVRNLRFEASESRKFAERSRDQATKADACAAEQDAVADELEAMLPGANTAHFTLTGLTEGLSAQFAAAAAAAARRGSTGA